MTDDELKAIEARMHAASPDLIKASIGTAFDANEFLSASVLYCDDDEDTPVWEFRTHGLPSPTAENDARLFAHAKRDIFHLCAEVRRLRAELADNDPNNTWTAAEIARGFLTASDVKDNK